MSSVASESAFSAGARIVTDRRTRLTPKSIKFYMLLKNWMDEEFRLNKLKKLERYRRSEMKEEGQEDEDGGPDLVINAQEDQEPDIERRRSAGNATSAEAAGEALKTKKVTSRSIWHGRINWCFHPELMKRYNNNGKAVWGSGRQDSYPPNRFGGRVPMMGGRRDQGGFQRPEGLDLGIFHPAIVGVGGIIVAVEITEVVRDSEETNLTDQEELRKQNVKSLEEGKSKGHGDVDVNISEEELKRLKSLKKKEKKAEFDLEAHDKKMNEAFGEEYYGAEDVDPQFGTDGDEDEKLHIDNVYPKLDKILFLDDHIVVQKDLTGLWSVDLHGKVNGESFHRFDKYLNFSNPHIAKNFNPNACGWAYGMNMFDLKEWKKKKKKKKKKKDITGIYHKWQNMVRLASIFC
ncbi:hypothetical protein SASPL_137931 [Salvia splendens]|uniref:Hexosyltransferase n=1 Tax=Salvia splendens TaxID=180675 RepID=A0A8X8WW49_SALSN|nr:hypothetical protein SASPL_137931 [Salvia splendens]